MARPAHQQGQANRSALPRRNEPRRSRRSRPDAQRPSDFRSRRLPVERETLEILAEKITRYANEADEKMIEAAKLVGEARKRIDPGEAGKVKWKSWAHENIKLCDTRLRELQRIAKAEDPRKEIERQRKMTQRRVERHRKKQKSAALRNDGAGITETAELEAVRQSLIDWAREAPLNQVTDVLSYAQQGDTADTNSSSDEPAETAAA